MQSIHGHTVALSAARPFCTPGSQLVRSVGQYAFIMGNLGLVLPDADHHETVGQINRHGGSIIGLTPALASGQTFKTEFVMGDHVGRDCYEVLLTSTGLAKSDPLTSAQYFFSAPVLRPCDTHRVWLQPHDAISADDLLDLEPYPATWLHNVIPHPANPKDRAAVSLAALTPGGRLN